MAHQVLLQPAYVLHQRAYRNTSALLEVLTRDHGRVGVIAKGVKAKSGAAYRGLLQPFARLLLSYSGRQDLHTLISAEAADDHARLSGQPLFSAFYLNELLMRLLHRGDAHERLFHDYDEALASLKRAEECEPVLRRFEMALLQELGYGLQLETEALSGNPIENGRLYYYDPQRGPVPARVADSRLPTISGACLRALAQSDFSERRYWPEMKTLMRGVITHYMDGRPLRSRELFLKE
ncbi:MAG TPA: DNA repair protein RecO [Gammaproteobacteria bacterium]|nr:DNA repair protein RecO [Gammaproteobacteria bacterium]